MYLPMLFLALSKEIMVDRYLLKAKLLLIQERLLSVDGPANDGVQVLGVVLDFLVFLPVAVERDSAEVLVFNHLYNNE